MVFSLVDLALPPKRAAFHLQCHAIPAEIYPVANCVFWKALPLVLVSGVGIVLWVTLVCYRPDYPLYSLACCLICYLANLSAAAIVSMTREMVAELPVQSVLLVQG